MFWEQTHGEEPENGLQMLTQQCYDIQLDLKVGMTLLSNRTRMHKQGLEYGGERIQHGLVPV